jgi:hypothetical protein
MIPSISHIDAVVAANKLNCSLAKNRYETMDAIDSVYIDRILTGSYLDGAREYNIIVDHVVISPSTLTAFVDENAPYVTVNAMLSKVVVVVICDSTDPDREEDLLSAVDDLLAYNSSEFWTRVEGAVEGNIKAFVGHDIRLCLASHPMVEVTVFMPTTKRPFGWTIFDHISEALEHPKHILAIKTNDRPLRKVLE